MSSPKFPKMKLKSELTMPLEKVVEFCRLFDENDIQIWLDGGWGVDALLEEQTRRHADLDIAIKRKDVPRLRQLLGARGYKDLERNDTRPWNFVLQDDNGHEIDVHAMVIDKSGNGVYGPPEKGVYFPSASLTGTGRIGDQSVRCISPEWVVKFHNGYKLHDTDFHDINAICQKFNIELPDEYKK